MSDSRRTPTIQKTVRTSWFGDWVEQKFDMDHCSHEVIYLSGIECVVSFKLDRFEFDGFYIPDGEEGKKEFKELRDYSVAHVSHCQHFPVQKGKAVLFHEIGHHICNHDERMYNLTPREILIHEIEAWKRGIDLWSIWGEQEFPEDFAQDYLNSYARFVPDYEWKSEISNYLNKKLN